MTPKVLIIEDQPSVHDLLEIFLGKKGCQVLWVETGAEGVKLARKEKPSVVLIDVHLPDGSGLDVLREIRSFDKEAKIYVFSGLYNEEQEEEAIAAGGAGFIDKARGIDVIVETILSALA